MAHKNYKYPLFKVMSTPTYNPHHASTPKDPKVENIRALPIFYPLPEEVRPEDPFGPPPVPYHPPPTNYDVIDPTPDIHLFRPRNLDKSTNINRFIDNDGFVTTVVKGPAIIPV